MVFREESTAAESYLKKKKPLPSKKIFKPPVYPFCVVYRWGLSRIPREFFPLFFDATNFNKFRARPMVWYPIGYFRLDVVGERVRFRAWKPTIITVVVPKTEFDLTNAHGRRRKIKTCTVKMTKQKGNNIFPVCRTRNTIVSICTAIRFGAGQQRKADTEI